ncbi:unnamed protein product [Absidia cylindrospora]
MRILSWNINGLATTLQYHPWLETKSYKNLLDTLEADIICLQEIKTQRQKLTRDMGLVPGYDGYFSYSKTKQGYSGVAIYVKKPLTPLSTDERITADLSPTFLDTLKTADHELLDLEGRCLVMDFGLFVLFNIYFPNDSGDTRMDFKMDYHRCVRQRIDLLLEQGRQVVLTGDVNAVHEEIDHCDPKQSLKEHGITNFKDLPHRQWVDQLLTPKGPMVDTGRRSHPNRKGMFTCWNTRINARPANFGTRIDYVLISQGLLPWFNVADIRADILGSDHCPVYADFWDTLPDNKDTRLMDLLSTHSSASLPPSPYLAANYPEFNQKKLMTFFSNSTAGSPPIANTTTSSPSSSPSPSSSSSSSSTTTATTTSPSPSTTLKRKNTTMILGNKRQQQQKQQQNTIKSFFTSNSNSNKQQKSKTSNNNNTNRLNKIDDNDLDATIDMEPILSQIEERKESNQVWSNLFQPPTIPTCQVHKSTCNEYTVSKKGPNQGRRFYLCSKPVGPQDVNSLDYRCDFFQWKHDKKN